MPFRYQGRVHLPAGHDYDAFPNRIVCPTSELASKALVLAEMDQREKSLPIGTRVKVEKIWHMNKGYEPGKPRHGEIVDSATVVLVEHGEFYDPKTGRPKKAKWVADKSGGTGRR